MISWQQIYERSIARIQGLARLLVLEKLAKVELRNKYIDSRRSLRGRRAITRPFEFPSNDLKADESLNALELSNYDVKLLHLPYGPGWTAQRTERLIYKNVCSAAEFQSYLSLLLSLQDFGLNCESMTRRAVFYPRFIPS